MRWKARLLTACLILAATPSAFAGFVVNIDSLSFAQGQTTGTLNVSISSTDGSPVNLTAFGFNFQIAPVNSAPPELIFVDPQPQPFSSLNYVFYNNSADQFAGAMLGNVSTTSTPNDTYSGSDGTNDGSNVVISSTTGAYLLLQLQVSLSPQFLQTAGTFDISLIPGSYGGLPGSPSSEVFFVASDPNSPSGVDYENFTSNVGTVTIPAVVPEPSSIALLATGVLSTLLAFRLRRRKSLALTGSSDTTSGRRPIVTPMIRTWIFAPTSPAWSSTSFAPGPGTPRCYSTWPTFRPVTALPTGPLPGRIPLQDLGLFRRHRGRPLPKVYKRFEAQTMELPHFTIRRLMIVIAVTGVALGLLRLHLGFAFIMVYAVILAALARSFVLISPNLATWTFIPAVILLDLSLIGEYAYMPLFHKSLFFVGSLFLLPIVPGLGLAWIVTREGRAARFKAALIVAVTMSVAASVLMTHWPLRLAFYVSSPALNRLADRVEAGGTLTQPEWAGLYRISSVQPFTNGWLMLRVNPTKGEMAGFMRKTGLAQGVGRETLYYGPEWGERWNYRDSW